ncbi:MAG: hypothetical protein NT038_00890 [Euryarchaeota archaeon]|nr:hypothetical protein [Euryarchaeota archaeon]
MIKRRITKRILSKKFRRKMLTFPTSFTISYNITTSASKIYHGCGEKIKAIRTNEIIHHNIYYNEQTVTCKENHLDPDNCNSVLTSEKRNVIIHPSKINKILSKIKYPKLLIFAIFFIAAYHLFCNNTYFSFSDIFGSLGYIQNYFAGFLYVFGFTAVPATALLASLPENQNIILAGLIGGLGALTGDLILFVFIKSLFTSEIRLLYENISFTIKIFVKGIVQEIKKVTQHRFIKILYPLKLKMSYSMRHYLCPIVGGFIIASPLPTEIGVTLIASSKKISLRKFACIVFILQTTAIVALIVSSEL